MWVDKVATLDGALHVVKDTLGYTKGDSQLVDKFNMGELLEADCVHAIMKGQFMFDRTNQTWLIWDGYHFVVDEGRLIQRVLTEFCVSLYTQLKGKHLKVLAELTGAEIEQEGEADEDTMDIESDQEEGEEESDIESDEEEEREEESARRK